MTYCTECNQEITWAETRNGRNIPLDGVDPNLVKIDHLSRLWIGSHPVYTVVKGQNVLASPQDLRLHRPLYICHFDTCAARRKKL